MRSPISVATLATLILLLSSPDGARAARSNPSSSKKAMIAQLFDLSEVPKMIRKFEESYARERVQEDPRVRDKKPPFDSEFTTALAASVDVEAIRRKVFDHIDQSFTERELKASLGFIRSKAGIRLNSLGEVIEQIVKQSCTSMLEENYERILSTRLREAVGSIAPTPSPAVVVQASPSPTPSPSLVAEPSRRPSPRVSEVEASWLTKMIWKLLPETNKCGCP